MKTIDNCNIHIRTVRAGMAVADLGAAPGGWTVVAGSNSEKYLLYFFFSAMLIGIPLYYTHFATRCHVLFLQ
jgi:23S rRNA U2552 (ribose-2'-O)-methylase RlmE/FtsJ